MSPIWVAPRSGGYTPTGGREPGKPPTGPAAGHNIPVPGGAHSVRIANGIPWCTVCNEQVNPVHISTSHDAEVAAKALRDAADAVAPELANEVHGHTSTYSVSRWLQQRAATIEADQ